MAKQRQNFQQQAGVNYDWNQWAGQWTGQQGGNQYAQYSIPTQIVPGPNGQPTALLQLQAGTSVKQLVVTNPTGKTIGVFPLTGGKLKGGTSPSFQNQNQGQGFQSQGQTGQYAMAGGNQQAAIKHLRSLAQSMGIPLQALISGSGPQQGYRQQKQRRQTSGRS